MGGYGAFVWSSYAISAVILISLLIASVRRLNKIERDLAPLEAAKLERRARRKGGASS
jgi:heme exporter protein D